MQLRAFVATGCSVSALGFGAMQAGDPALREGEAQALLNGALVLPVRCRLPTPTPCGALAPSAALHGAG